MSDIQDVLDQITQCPCQAGALLATADGLTMASAGNLHGDAAAAATASLALAGRDALTALGAGPWAEQLIWSDNQVWYQTRLHGTHLLLLVCNDPGHAGALRWTGRLMAQQLELALLRL
jgi:predicted regulator of Ras-like GTPase activity (Roadblock/LC7/MglB family)|nr:roadblock/LC7 domain-containing protein [uncultured Acidovorax sp.]